MTGFPDLEIGISNTDSTEDQWNSVRQSRAIALGKNGILLLILCNNLPSGDTQGVFRPYSNAHDEGHCAFQLFCFVLGPAVWVQTMVQDPLWRAHTGRWGTEAVVFFKLGPLRE